MKINDAYSIVKNSMSANVPVMLWGPPGIGKSSLVHQIAKELDLNVIDLRLAQLEPTDLRGVPMPNRDTMRAEWFLPNFWPTVATEDTTRVVKDRNGNPVLDKDGNKVTAPVKAGNGVDGPGVIFLDEIEKAPVSVKNASLQLVLDRAIGTYNLPNDWVLVCAGNREEDGCFSQPLGKALANRMIHMEVEPDPEDWAAWARNNGISEDIIGFIYFKPEYLYKNTEENAFPTPRSWEIASRLIQNVKSKRDQKDLLTASVGRGVAQEYTVWSNVYREVDPEKIFAGEMPDFKGQDQSYKYAVTLAVAFHLRKRKGGVKKAEQHIAEFLGTITPELRVLFLRQQTLPVLESMAKHASFKDRVKDIMKIAV